MKLTKNHTCSADKITVGHGLQDPDLEELQQQHHNLEASNSHMLKWLMKYHLIGHPRQGLQVSEMACINKHVS